VITCGYWSDVAVNKLQMLDAFKFVDCAANHLFLMDTQDQIVGGFSKWPDHTPGTADHWWICRY